MRPIRSALYLCLLPLLGGVFAFAAKASDGTLSLLVSNGPPEKRINLVIFSEGYRTSENQKFLTDAATSADFFLKTQPFLEYRSYFNIYGIFVPSVDSGSDHPSQGLFKNTYFNSKFDTYGRPELLSIPPNDVDQDPSHGDQKVYQLLSDLLPLFDVPLILVNDPAYGGSAGTLAVASLHTTSQHVLIHEFGHIFAGLGDEYADPAVFPDIEEPNTTRETNRALIKWNVWISPTTPIPTPATLAYATNIGLFEGAHYHSTGWFRPKLNCKMRSVTALFCQVCSEALVKSVYQRVRPIEQVLPANPAVRTLGFESISFQVQTLQPRTNQLTAQWILDNQIVANATNKTFLLTTAELASGAHQLRVRVKDQTSLVRNDPDLLLQQEFEWLVEVPSKPQIVNARLLNEQFVFSIQNPPGNYVLETSTNLLNWTTISTNTSSVTNFQATPSSDATFFRVRQI